jgi:hypothetical protein
MLDGMWDGLSQVMVGLMVGLVSLQNLHGAALGARNML